MKIYLIINSHQNKKRNINGMSRIFKPDYEIHSDQPKTYLIGSNQEMSHNF